TSTTSFSEPPLAAGAGNVYVALTPTRIVAFDAPAGRGRWDVTLGDMSDSSLSSEFIRLVADATAVYVQSPGGQIIALAAGAGAILGQVAPPLSGELNLFTRSTLGDGLLIAALHDTTSPDAATLLALRTANGSLAWQRSFQAAGFPVFFDGDTVATFDGKRLH